MDVMEQSTNSYSHVQQYVDNGLLGAIRTTGQKVYFMRLANLPGDMPQSSLNNMLPINFEVPLYDYSVQIGDTVPWKYGNKVVQAID